MQLGQLFTVDQAVYLFPFQLRIRKPERRQKFSDSAADGALAASKM